MSDHEIEFFEDDAGEWRWRRKAANGEIISDSAEGYTERNDAVEGARRANPDLYPEEEPNEAPA